MNQRAALRWYGAGAAAARTGDEMSGTALLLAGLAVTGSAATASSLLAALTVSAAIGGPVFGALLDRSARPGRLLAGALAGYASGLVIILVTLGRVPVFVSVLVALCAGLLGPALSGGWTSQLPRLVPYERLPRANALDAMTFNGASLAGPALAGAVAGVAGAPAGVAVATALICLALPSALALPTLRTRAVRSVRAARRPKRAGRPPMDGPSPDLATTLATDVAAGFRAIVRIRPLARATTTSVVSCVGQGMLVACAPLLGARVFGSPAHGALLLSGVAVAALTANAVLSARPRPARPDTVVAYGPLVIAGGLLLAATGHPVPVVAAALLVGLGEGPQLTGLFAIRHREAPERLRGQIFNTGASLKITGFALGAGVAGPLATWSLPGALLTAAGVQALATLWFVVSRYARRGRRPSRGPWSRPCSRPS
ncbi:MFS transporter [Streptomyces sp. NPDC060366]|uniref:MFS transporter n=1 Tax=Streptomyces sp. NPDC060366 TaxID=3347105 RepID=UPI00365FF934